MAEPMGDMVDELLRKIDKLEVANGKLCAEINRQERVIEEQRAQITRLVAANDARAERIAELERERDEWQLKCCEEAGLHASHVFQRDELIRDMYDVAARGEFDVGEEANFVERMRELGLEAVE